MRVLACLFGLFALTLSTSANSLEETIAQLKKSAILEIHTLDSIQHDVLVVKNSDLRDSLRSELEYLYRQYFDKSNLPDSALIHSKKSRFFLDTAKSHSAFIFNSLGSSEYDLGNTRLALTYYDSAIYFARRDGKIQELIATLNQASVLYSELHQRDREVDALKEALALADSVQDIQQQTSIQINLAIALYESRLYDDAIEILDNAIVSAGTLQDSSIQHLYLAYAYSNLANIYGELNQHDTCIVLNQIALEHTPENHVLLRAYIANSMGSSFMELNKLAEAEIQLGYAYHAFSKTHMAQPKVRSAAAYAGVLIEKGNYDPALKLSKSLISFADSISDFGGLVNLYVNLSKIYMHKNQLEDAKQYMNLALNYKDSIRQRYQDEAVTEMKVKLDLAKGEVENEWLKKQNELKDGVIASSRIMNLMAVLLILLFLGLLLLTYRNQRSLKTQQAILHEKHEALTASYQHNERILALIAHDVRGPITSVESLMAMIDNAENEEEKSGIVAMARGSLSTIHNLIDSLLNWSRKEKGLALFHPKWVSVAEELEIVFQIYKHQLRGKNITFQSRVSKHSLVFADQHMLSTMLRNIITNAIKFTHQGGNVTVEFHVGSDSDELCISDTGIGISKEQINQIIKGEAVAQRGTAFELGTGLGMVMVRDMMTRHGGRLEIKSIEGEGSTFCMFFPKKEHASYSGNPNSSSVSSEPSNMA